MRERQIRGIEEGLAKVRARLESLERTLRDRDKANRRIGRLLQKYSRAAHLYDVSIDEVSVASSPGGKRLSLNVEVRRDLREWVEQADGCYLLRTNLADADAPTLWKTYIGLTQIEDCFRVTKSDLGLRPIYHQREDRVRAHILVCFLSLALWRTLSYWMESSGLGGSPRALVRELGEVRGLDVILPTRGGRDLRLRTVGRPDPELAVLLERLGLPLPNRPRKIQNVVETFT